MINDLPDYITYADGKYYCTPFKEMKEALGGGYDGMCKKCPLKDRCKIVGSFKFEVPGDFHAANASVFFPEFNTATDKARKKELRAKAKVIGLGFLYSGLQSAHIIRNQLGYNNCTFEEAQVLADNYRTSMPEAVQWCKWITDKVVKEGKQVNFFGFTRYLDDKLAEINGRDFKAKMKGLGYIHRQTWNFEQQSGGASILQILIWEHLKLIRENKWDPLATLEIPRKLPAGTTYKDTKSICAFSVHDETDFILAEDTFLPVLSAHYETQRLKHIFKNFLHTNLRICCDSEYDKTYRSFSAATLMPVSKIFYTINEVLPHTGYKLLNQDKVDEKPKEIKPKQENDTLKVSYQDNPQFIILNLPQLLKQYLDTHKKETDLYFVSYIDKGGKSYLSQIKFPKGFLDELGVKYSE